MPRPFSKKLPDTKTSVAKVQDRVEDVTVHLRGALDGFRDGMGLPKIDHSPRPVNVPDGDAEFLTLLG